VGFALLEDARDMAGQIAKTDAYVVSRRKRKEMALRIRLKLAAEVLSRVDPASSHAS